MGSVHSAGLNQAIVVSGGCTTGERKMVRGGWVWAWWLISDVQVCICYILFRVGFRFGIMNEKILQTFHKVFKYILETFIGNNDTRASM